MPRPSTPKNDTPQLSSDDSRLFRVLLFCIITWTVAGSFIALDSLTTVLFTRARNNGVVPSKLAMHPPAARDCRSALEQAQSSAPDGSTVAQASLIVWTLGYDVGLAIALRNAYPHGEKKCRDCKTYGTYRATGECFGHYPANITSDHPCGRYAF